MADNIQPLDEWTQVHFALGVLARLFGIGRLPYYFFTVVYEIIEHGMQKDPKNPWGAPRPESIGNKVADICAGALGYEMVARLESGK